MEFTLNKEEYESLVALARQGVAGDPLKLTELDRWLQLIEGKNGIERDFVWVQWQEIGKPLEVGTNFPEKWPPELRRSIEFVSRKVARVDVDAVLEQYANQPITVLVTRDPAAKVGWTPVDDFFVT